MTATLITLPFRPTINLRGGVEPGAILEVYASGTLTPVSIFADGNLTTPLSNPLEADAFGVFPDVYFDDATTVRVVMKQANGTILSDTDPYVSNPASAEASADAAAASAAEAADTLAAVNAAGTTQVAAVNAAGATQVAAVETAGQIAATSVGVLAAQAGEIAATGDYDILYQSNGPSNGALLGSNFGVLQVVLDVGVDLEAGQAMSAVQRKWSAATGSTQTELKIWKRDIAAATTAGTLNSPAPQAQDTLLLTVTRSPTDDLGLTLGAAATMMKPLDFGTTIIAEAGFAYVFEMRNRDASDVTTNCAYTFGSWGTVAQRRSGFRAATATPTTFGNIVTSQVTDITVLADRLTTTMPADIERLDTLVGGEDARLLAAMNEANKRNLYINAAQFPNTLAVQASRWGDSLTFDGNPGAGYKSWEIINGLIDGSVNNYGINGQTSAQITARVVAATADEKAGFNDVTQGANDFGTAKTAAEILTDYATCAAAFTNANFLFPASWQNGVLVASDPARKAWDVRAGLKETYGPKMLDMMHFWARHWNGTDDQLQARRGAVPTDLTVDNFHNNDAGGLLKGHVYAAALIARNGGAPFVHDDMFGIKAGDAAGTSIANPLRFLGSAKNFQILAGNEDSALSLDRITGALSRGAGAIAAPYREMFVGAENNKGVGRNGRIIIVQQMDGTDPQSAVKVVGNGASVLTARSDFAPAAGKEMTIVLCARINNFTGGTIISGPANAFLSKTSEQLSFSPRRANGTALASLQVAAREYADYNFYFLTIDAANNVMAGVVNEQATVAASPANDDIALAQMTTFFTNNPSDASPLVDFDLKMLAVYPAYYDITDSAVRAEFYDSVTKLPKDIGDGTAGGTFAQPLFYFRGMAGDYLLGKNFGSGGDMHVPIPLGKQNLGFVDLAR